MNLLEDLQLALFTRDRRAFADLVSQAAGLKDQDRGVRDAVVKLFFLLCPADAAEASVAPLLAQLPPVLVPEIRALLAFLSAARSLKPEVALHLDLSELGSQGYHSGTVFQAYVEGLSSAVGAGGRYDKLLHTLGLEVPAVGWSVMLSRLLPLATKKPPVETTVELSARGDRALDLPPASSRPFAERYAEAQALRAAGKKVAL